MQLAQQTNDTITHELLHDILYQYGFFSTLTYQEIQNILFFHGSPTNVLTRSRRCVIQFVPWRGTVKITLGCAQVDHLVYLQAESLQDLKTHIKFANEFLHAQDS